MLNETNAVIPANAGIQTLFIILWTPAFAGVTLADYGEFSGGFSALAICDEIKVVTRGYGLTRIIGHVPTGHAPRCC